MEMIGRPELFLEDLNALLPIVKLSKFIFLADCETIQLD